MKSKPNRHGIPVYEFGTRRPTRPRPPLDKPRKPYGLCCWPDCDINLKPGNYFGPLCAMHAFNIYLKAETFESIEWSEMRVQAGYRVAREQQQQAELSASRGSAPGFIYFALIDGQIKVGYAAEVKKRMRSYPPTAELLAVHPGTKDLERQLHQQFRAHLMRGREWFKDCDEIRAYCTQTVTTFGDPARYAYHFREARPVAVLRPKGGVRHVAG